MLLSRQLWRPRSIRIRRVIQKPHIESQISQLHQQHGHAVHRKLLVEPAARRLVQRLRAPPHHHGLHDLEVPVDVHVVVMHAVHHDARHRRVRIVERRQYPPLAGGDAAEHLGQVGVGDNVHGQLDVGEELGV